VTESAGLVIKNVLRGSAAEAAGMAAGDEWLALELPPQGDEPGGMWRVRKLDDVALYAHGQTKVTAWLARDGRVLRCPLAWPDPDHTVKLHHEDYDNRHRSGKERVPGTRRR
jgi:hypothetical protein